MKYLGLIIYELIKLSNLTLELHFSKVFIILNNYIKDIGFKYLGLAL